MKIGRVRGRERSGWASTPTSDSVSRSSSHPSVLSLSLSLTLSLSLSLSSFLSFSFRIHHSIQRMLEGAPFTLYQFSSLALLPHTCTHHTHIIHTSSLSSATGDEVSRRTEALQNWCIGLLVATAENRMTAGPSWAQLLLRS